MTFTGPNTNNRCSIVYGYTVTHVQYGPGTIAQGLPLNSGSPVLTPWLTPTFTFSSTNNAYTGTYTVSINAYISEHEDATHSSTYPLTVTILH